MNLYVTESYLKRKHFLEIRIDSVHAKVGFFFGLLQFRFSGCYYRRATNFFKAAKKEF